MFRHNSSLPGASPLSVGCCTGSSATRAPLVGGGAGARATGLLYRSAARLVVLAQLLDPPMQAEERKVVAGEDQRVDRNARLETGQ